MNLFLDTNIILDFLASRAPHNAMAARLFVAQSQGRLSLFTSSVTVVNALHIVRTTYKLPEARKAIEKLTSKLVSLPTSQQAIRKSFTSAFIDFEDAVQHFTALEHGEIDYIITRDAKGFAKSEIPVLSPRSFVARHLTNGAS